MMKENFLNLKNIEDAAEIEKENKSSPDIEAALGAGSLKKELRSEVEVKTNNLDIPPKALAWFQQVDRQLIEVALERFCLTRVDPVGVYIAAAVNGGRNIEELVILGKTEAGQSVKSSLAVREI